MAECSQQYIYELSYELGMSEYYYRMALALQWIFQYYYQ